MYQDKYQDYCVRVPADFMSRWDSSPSSVWRETPTCSCRSMTTVCRIRSAPAAAAVIILRMIPARSSVRSSSLSISSSLPTLSCPVTITVPAAAIAAAETVRSCPLQDSSVFSYMSQPSEPSSMAADRRWICLLSSTIWLVLFL